MLWKIMSPVQNQWLLVNKNVAGQLIWLQTSVLQYTGKIKI